MSEERPAATRATTTAGEGGWSPVRVRLADLMTWVMGAGVAAAVCREVRPAGWLAPTRILGLVAALLAIVTGMGLFRQAVAWVRRRRVEGDAACLVPVAWRLAVLGLLGAALVAEASLLGDVASVDRSDPRAVRLRLLPLAMTLALAGIVAGLAPGRAPGAERPRRMVGLSVIWAAAAGVMIAMTQAPIPYLVLLAMDAVRNARSGPVAWRSMRPDLHGRILRVGVESAPVLACCLALGLLVARELRQPSPPRRGAGAPGRGVFALLAATAATGAGAAWLLAVTIPRLDEWLAEGLWVVVDPPNAGILVLGFAGLALGPAARAHDRPEPPGREAPGPRPRASAWRALGSLILALIVLAFIAARAIDLVVVRRATDGGPVDGSWARWVGWVDAAFNWLQSVVPFRGPPPWDLFEAPEWLVLALAEAWVAWRVAPLLVASIGDRRSPIDASLADRRASGRFALRWAALTVLMIASLPASFLVGVALLHVLIRGPA